MTEFSKGVTKSNMQYAVSVKSYHHRDAPYNISVLLIVNRFLGKVGLCMGTSVIPHNTELQQKCVTYSSRQRQRRRQRSQVTMTIMTMISGMMTAGTATAAVGVPASTASVTVSVAT